MHQWSLHASLISNVSMKFACISSCMYAWLQVVFQLSVHVILNRVFWNAKIRKSPLFFVASDDSKDHERPNKDSKRWRKGMRRILLRSLSLAFVGRVVVGPFTFRKCLCSSSFRSEFSILSCSNFFFPLLFSSLLTTTTTTAQQEEEEKKNVNSNR